jgi:hypothetical protein
MANGKVKMVQEGFVLDLPNKGLTATVSGMLSVSLGFVGMWNESGFAPDANAPMIVNGVVDVAVSAGAQAIARGASLNIDTDTMTLVAGREPDADAADADGDLDNDTLIYFGKSLGIVPANATRRIWIKIKPQ